MQSIKSFLIGIAATLFGLALAHLVAALTEPASSPVLAVGSSVIDATPTPVKEWAVATFGTNDKPLLIGSVLLGTLLLAGLAGLLARRSRALGVALIVVLAALAGAAALARPTATATAVLPALAAGVGGVAVLLWLTAKTTGSPPATPAEGTATASGPGRRGLLIAGALTGAATLALAGGAQALIRASTTVRRVLLPAAANAAPPIPAGLDVAGVSSLVTPNRDFYRVDTALITPSVDVDSWELTIDGSVEREVSFTFDELAAMPLVERHITLNCVSNEVGGPYIGGATWLGVPLLDLLNQAGIEGTSADQILSTSVDGYTSSTPLAAALDGREILVAIGMNGEQLPRDHGFPARLITPGLYGFVGATKWLTRLTLTTYAAKQAYWTERGWATDAPVKLQSRIDTPKPLSTISAGATAIGGVAWAQPNGISAVEVRVDGGPWRPATLGPAVNGNYWRQWYLPWDAQPGQHFLAVRATNGLGEVQTAVRAETFPAGASGIQEVLVTVT